MDYFIGRVKRRKYLPNKFSSLFVCMYEEKGISQLSQLDVICSQSAYKITNAWIKLDPWRAWPLLDLGIINILNQRILFPTADRDNCICNTLFVTNKPSVIRDYTNHEIIDILNTLPLLSIVIIFIGLFMLDDARLLYL